MPSGKRPKPSRWALDNGLREARRMRDGAYTLMMSTERRIRAAATYWYEGTNKMKEYLAYVAPAGAAADSDAEEVVSSGETGTSADTAAPGKAAPAAQGSSPQ